MPLDNEKLKQRVKGAAKFAFFRDGTPWYETDDGWQFPIPVSDTTNGQGNSPTFGAVERGIYLMKWIRKAMIEPEFSPSPEAA